MTKKPLSLPRSHDATKPGSAEVNEPGAPALDSPSPCQGPASGCSATKGGPTIKGKRVLVCDDEPHILHVVAAKLRNAGLEVVTASDGREALELATADPPDLVFTDYQMPHLSGLELCANLRSNAATRNVPAVMLTARGFSLGPADLAGTNILRVLVKPFSPREILRAAQEIIEANEPRAPASGCPATKPPVPAGRLRDEATKGRPEVSTP
jgi:CheY-like chemotaxis protein